MTKHEAILKLYPQVRVIRGDDAFDSEDSLVAYDEAAVQAEMDANAYKNLRASEYPSIQDQLDTLYHGGYDAWKATIESVKNKYPKV